MNRRLLLFMALVTLPHVARAHPIHTTLSVLTPASGAISLSIRVFADDFSASVARFAGKRPPVDSSASDADVLRYVRAHVAVRDANGAEVVLVPCGVRRVNELYWLCFTAPAANAAKGLRLSNQMLTELHADQVNIVQVEQHGARKTMLFTKGSAPAAIG